MTQKMSKRIQFTRVVIALVLLIVTAGVVLADDAPKNVILLIGDGNGITHITATRIALGSPDAKLNVDTMPVTGFAMTHSASNVVTDSAASATALATGMRTNNSRVATLPDGRELKSWLLMARDKGMGTGVVTTDSIVGATPGSFLATATARGFAKEIAEEVANSGVDVIFGGGLDEFSVNPFTREPRRSSPINSALEQGYNFITTRDELTGLTSGEKVLGLFSLGRISYDSERFNIEPSLTEMTAKSLELLQDHPNGFALMIEGARIDHASHDNKSETAIEEGLVFNEAIGLVLDFARERGDTLVVVTADHETGGFGIVGGSSDGSDVEHDWLHGDHTGEMVPIYAYGPGAERFAGTHHHTDTAKNIAALLGLEPFPQYIEQE